MNKSLYIVILVSLCLIVASYYVGYANGLLKAFNEIVEKGPSLVNVSLKPQVISVLLSQPELLRKVMTPESIKSLQDQLLRAGEVKGGLGPEGIGRNITL